jgi:DNA-binding NtrC family response regulator
MDGGPAARTIKRHVMGVIMRKPRVIIYDDDVSLLKLLEACFARWGYEVFAYRSPVVCPANGNSAHECNCQAPCADLMISDFLMPQMTGTELFWLQAERGCKVAKKAIMSGYSEEKLLRLCEDAGYRYLEKPFNFEKLTNWLGACKSNFDLSKQLGGRPAEARHGSRPYIENCLNPSGLQEKNVGFKADKSRSGLAPAYSILSCR